MSTTQRFHIGPLQLPWFEGVDVRSAADLDAVRELIDDRHAERRAVYFIDLTASQRRPLVQAVEDLGVELQEISGHELRALNPPSPLGLELVMRLFTALAVSVAVSKRLRGRTNKCYEITPTQ